MRPIKFRAWDNRAKKFIYVGDKNTNGKGLIMNLNGDLIEDDDKGSFIHSLMWARIGGEYKLEQYTGLKDKNGKDIYEGDLIQRFSIEFPSRKEVPCEIYEVRWGLWGFELYRKEEPNVTNHYISPKLIEVIGNIHENPELLEAKL